MMNINKKIEQIRRQPEHVRMKYVWGTVSVCMFFIIIIWIFSVKLMFRENNAQQDFSQLKKSFTTENIEMPSIEKLSDQEGISEELLQNTFEAEKNTPGETIQTQQISDQSDQLQQNTPEQKTGIPQKSEGGGAFPIE